MYLNPHTHLSPRCRLCDVQVKFEFRSVAKHLRDNHDGTLVTTYEEQFFDELDGIFKRLNDMDINLLKRSTAMTEPKIAAVAPSALMQVGSMTISGF